VIHHLIIRSLAFPFQLDPEVIKHLIYITHNLSQTVSRDEYHHNWQGIFRIIICDEAHEIRNMDAMSFEMMKQCEAEFT